MTVELGSLRQENLQLKADMETVEQETRHKIEELQKRSEEEINVLAEEYQKLKEESDSTQNDLQTRLDQAIKRMKEACESSTYKQMQIREMESEKVTMEERQSMLGEEVSMLAARVAEKN